MRTPSRACVPLLVLVLALAACGGDEDRLYAGRGVVRDVSRDEGQVVLAHDDIEDLMPAMTMNFDVPDPALLARLAPGQVIDFALRVRGGRYAIIGANVVAAAEGGEGGSLAALAAPAEPAPGFELIDQDGAPLSLEDLRGRAVLLDFVFTSCPGPCPILTGTHVSLQRLLPESLRDRVRLVSISIDPQRDTGERLRAYAEARGADLSSWSFLTGDPARIDRVMADYGVGSVRRPGEEIEHTVATFLIDPEGRIAKRYLGLSHEPETLLEDLRALL